MNDPKALVKEARDAISEKRHNDAVELCQRALARDPHNYLAHVMLGASLQQKPAAEKAFRSAIQLQPHKPLAWQGLATHFERRIDEDDKTAAGPLLTVYSELLTLETDKVRLCDLFDKVAGLGKEPLLTAHAAHVLSHYEGEPGVLEKLAVLLRSDSVLAKPAPDTARLVHQALSRQPSDEQLAFNCVRLLARHLTVPLLLQECEDPNISKSAEARAWLSKHVLERFVEEEFPSTWEAKACERVGGRARCVSLYLAGSYREAYEMALQDEQEVDGVLRRFLLECALKLHEWTAASDLATALSLQNPSDVRIARAQLLCCARLERWRQGSGLGRRIRELDSCDVYSAMLLAECALRCGARADDVVQELGGTQYGDASRGLALLVRGDAATARDLLLASTEQETAERWLYLGEAFTKLGDHKASLQPLLRAARLDSGRPTCFLLLGHYYSQTNQLDKARRCYERALALNPRHGEAARALSDVLRASGDACADRRHVAQLAGDPGAGWARLRLGLHELSQRRWDAAVVCLRDAARAFPQDRLAWSALGDAYSGRRSLVSALKCYARAAELATGSGGDANYERTQLSAVRLEMGETEQAADGYREVLKDSPRYLPALLGLSQALRARACEHLAEQLYGRSRAALQEAFEYGSRAAATSPDTACTWRGVGDTLLQSSKLPAAVSGLKVPGGCPLELAVTCYMRAAKVAKNPIPFYYDAGVASLALSRSSGDSSHARRAVSAALLCARRQPADPRHWELLGAAATATKQPRLAQYGFLRALAAAARQQMDGSARVWSNLGALQLSCQEPRLANRTLRRAQELDPDYAPAWVGQALVAEALCESEAADLFRHAASVEFLPAAALGYASRAPDVVGALNLVERAALYLPTDPTAQTLLGLVRERAGLLRSAADAYAVALETSGGRKPTEIAACRRNLSRALVRCGRHHEALQTLSDPNRDDKEAELGNTLLAARALHMAGNDEAAMAALTMCDSLCETDSQRADILVALAGIQYSSGSPEDAKTTLFQAVRAAPSEPRALLATCALALLTSDDALAELAANELRKLKTVPKREMALLEARLRQKAGDTAGAAQALVSSDDAGWRRAAAFWLRVGEPENSLTCARRALVAERARTLAGPAFPMAERARTLLVASAAEARCGEESAARLLAQHAARLCPECSAVSAAIARFM